MTALLLVGTSASWADGLTTVTYDFTKYSDQGLTSSGVVATTNNSANVYCPSQCTTTFGSRFAFQYNTNSEWSINNSRGGLWMYSKGSKDDNMSILGLKAGDIVTLTLASGKIFAVSNFSGTYYASEAATETTTGTVAKWGVLISDEDYTITADGAMHIQAKKYTETRAYMVLSKVVIQTSATETVTAPTITSEATDGGRNVTITDGLSSLYSGVTTYYTTDGSTPTTLSTKYTGTFLQASTATIKAITVSNSSAATASDVASKLIDLDVESVTAPTIGSPAYAGANRTVTITSGTSSKGNTVTTYYTTDGTDPTSLSSVYSSPLNISEACTVKAISISSTSVASSITSQAVTVGKLTLNAPTFTKTGYSEGSYTVTIAQDQSDLEFVPATTTIKYRVGTTGDYSTYSSAVSVAAGKTLYAYVEADNYTNSSTAYIQAVATPAMTLDFGQNFVGVVNDNLTMTVSSGPTVTNAKSTADANYFIPSTDGGTTAATNENISFYFSYDSSDTDKNKYWTLKTTGMYAPTVSLSKS